MTATTTDYATAVERYLAVWNEPDPARRRALAEAAFTADAAYTDPLAAVTGRDAVDMVVGAVRNEFPGLRFTLAGAVDGHHDLVRFTWHLGPEDGEALVIGFDVAVLAEDGRIRAVHGFLDKVPAGD